MKSLHNFLVRAAQRVAVVVLVLGLLVAASGGWIVIRDQHALREDLELSAQHGALLGAIEAAEQRIVEVEASIPAEQDRVLRSEKVVAELRQLTGTWEWFAGNREQQRLNQERLKKMEALHVDVAANLASKQEELRRLRWERDGDRMEVQRIESQLRFSESEKRASGYRFSRVWLQVRGWIVVGLAAYILGPVLAVACVRRWRTARAAAV
jgi:hypothetical protein